MGMSFSNLFIRVSPGEVDRLAEALTAALAPTWVPAVAGQPHGRRFEILQASDDWLLIREPAAVVPTGMADQLAQKLFERVGVPIICTSVYDSDVYAATILQSGESSQRFERRMTGPADSLGADLTAWATLLPSNRTAAELQSAWERRATFAEEIAAAVADTFDWDARSVGSAPEDDAENGGDILASLDFRLVKEPKQLYGPPHLTLHSRSFMEGAVGNPLDALFLLTNLGGRFEGLAVELIGEGLSLMNLEAIEATFWSNTLEYSLRAPVVRTGGRFHVSFPDVVVYGAAPEAPQPSLHLALIGKYHRPGIAGVELVISAIRHDGGDGTRDEVRVAVSAEVWPKPHRPLRVLRGPGIRNRVAELHGPFAVALALLEPDANDWKSRSARALRVWLGHLARIAGDLEQIRLRQGEERGTRSTVKSARLMDPGDIEDRLSETESLLFGYTMPNESSVRLARHPAPWPPWGCAIYRPRAASHTARQLIHVALWGRTSEWTGASEADKALASIVDDLQREGDFVQGFSGRFNWLPSNKHAIRVTPYEAACGLAGHVTTCESWGKRWLRAVTPNLWLGPDLLQHLGSDAIDQLAIMGHVQRIRDGIHVRIPRERLAVMELSVLAPILPARADETAVTSQNSIS